MHMYCITYSTVYTVQVYSAGILYNNAPARPVLLPLILRKFPETIDFWIAMIRHRLFLLNCRSTINASIIHCETIVVATD